METAKSSEDEKPTKSPSPSEFDVFLPWAFKQLRGAENVTVKKIIQTDYVSSVGKPKDKRKTETTAYSLQDDQEYARQSSVVRSASDIQVLAIYDKSDKLSQLQFKNNFTVPRLIFKIINLIIQYHQYLNTITINRGLDKYSLYEICKFLPYSQITDICLDNATLKEGNYHILLEQKSLLRYLSLQRCCINDIAVEAIANTLRYPTYASKTLAILNLASNRITDKGASYLAEALRSNRQLKYLNLADNSITDLGGNCLLDTMNTFPLTFAELLASRSRQMDYLKEKKELIVKMVDTLRAGEIEKRNTMGRGKQAKKSISAKPKGLEREGSLKSVPTSKSLPNLNQMLNEKAILMAERELGDFTDPFDKTNTEVKDTIVYCLGNNSLCYLNIAYNNLTYITLKKLITVLKYQRDIGRTPKGLINVIIEGNYMPVSCTELDQVENILEAGLLAQVKRSSISKKRSPARVTTK